MSILGELIRRVSGKNSAKLLEEGENESVKKNIFKEKLVKDKSKLSPEQLREDFLIENGLAKWMESPFCKEFLLSIKYINEIKDMQSYDKAKEKLQFKQNESNSKKEITFSDNFDNYRIVILDDDTIYHVSVQREFRSCDVIIYELETRKYDSKTGFEVERHLKSTRIREEYWSGKQKVEAKDYYIIRYLETKENLGIAEVFDGYYKLKDCYDLTVLPSDIGSLELFDEDSIFDRGPTSIIGVSLKAGIIRSKLENDEGYKKRLEEKLAKSKGNYHINELGKNY